MNNNPTKNLATFAVLAAMMAATRINHFGDALHLPDASLAIFLLAGSLFTMPWLFAVLLLEAGVLDYLAITHFGVSDWCVTPAYGFLIPAYAVLWYAGRYYARVHQHSLRSLGMFACLSVVALNLAFLISNGSFYLFSGRVQNVSAVEYGAGMAQFYIPYLSGGLLYLACAAALYTALASRASSGAMTENCR